MNLNEILNLQAAGKNDGLLESASLLNLSSYMDLIAVHEPYHALHSYQVKNGCLYARFPLQAHIAGEAYPITTAETGRHMAILGSMALALANPLKEQHYYLAIHAVVKRVSFTETFEQELIGRISTWQLGRKSGKVTGEVLTDTNEILYEVEVDYSVMHHNVFERLFKDNYRPEDEVFDVNPFLEEVKISNIELGVEMCMADIGAVVPFECCGHFKHYPALPVARLGGALTKLSGIHFNFMRNNAPQKYAFRRSEITAHFLPFAGEEIYLQSQIENANYQNGMIVRAAAYTSDSKLVAQLVSHIEPIIF